MDLTKSIEANSEQVNAEDLLSGPRTVTITGVEQGSKEQPVFVHLAEFPNRTYRPGKSMRRVIVSAWGTDSSSYIGKQMNIYCDPEIRFGGQAVGGIRISHMTGLSRPLTVALTVSRGKREPFTVQPIAAAKKPQDTSGRDWLGDLEIADGDASAVSALGNAAIAAHASPEVIAAIRQVHSSLVAEQVQA